jgi:hypothetical protein
MLPRKEKRKINGNGNLDLKKILNLKIKTKRGQIYSF